MKIFPKRATHIIAHDVKPVLQGSLAACSIQLKTGKNKISACFNWFQLIIPCCFLLPYTSLPIWSFTIPPKSLDFSSTCSITWFYCYIITLIIYWYNICFAMNSNLSGSFPYLPNNSCYVNILFRASDRS
jgi:hypothetical protein